MANHEPTPQVSQDDLMRIGMATLNIISMCNIFGHASPANTIDYLEPVEEQDWRHALVADLVAWVGRRQHVRPGCEERVRAIVQTTDWYDKMFAIAEAGLAEAKAE